MIVKLDLSVNPVVGKQSLKTLDKRPIPTMPTPSWVLNHPRLSAVFTVRRSSRATRHARIFDHW